MRPASSQRAFCRQTLVTYVLPSPSFSTRGVCNAGRRSRTTSWSKGLYHRSDVLVLIQKLTARANAGWRLSRQCELELLEQDFMIGLWMGRFLGGGEYSRMAKESRVRSLVLSGAWLPGGAGAQKLHLFSQIGERISIASQQRNEFHPRPVVSLAGS